MSKRDEFYTSILSNINLCYQTGYEQTDQIEVIGEYVAMVFKDHVGNYRVQLVSSGEVVSGILYDHVGEARVRYTKPSHRGQRLSKQLFAWMDWKYPKMNFHHSAYLTVAGENSL